MRGALGFREKWIHLVLSCVSSVKYSVLINGQPGKFFTPSRGLRQGNLLSSYLFLMCAESLSSLIMKAEIRGDIQGLSVTQRGTSINHFLFADDSILFYRASKVEWGKIRGILNTYKKGPSQILKEQKFSIFLAQKPPLTANKR